MRSDEKVQTERVPGLLTTAEAAKVMRCSVRDVYRMVESRRLPVAYRTMHRRLLFSPVDVMRVTAERRRAEL